MIDIHKLTPLSSRAKPFHEQIRELVRPYTPITEDELNQLECAGVDFFLTTDQQVVTFGNADGGYALMPLNADAAAEILEAEQRT